MRTLSILECSNKQKLQNCPDWIFYKLGPQKNPYILKLHKKKVLLTREILKRDPSLNKWDTKGDYSIKKILKFI